MSKRRVLVFVCSGNICRSPMAAVIAQDAARKERMALSVVSAGIAALDGDPADASARAAVEALGLSLESHVAQGLTPSTMDEAALVLGVTGHHRDQIRQMYPEHAWKVASFDDVTGLGDLDDPYGGRRDEFERTADRLVRGMPAVLSAMRVF